MHLLLNFCRENNIAYRENAPLSELSSFKIGGAAALIIMPKTEAELGLLCREAYRREVPLEALGKGSNILFADKGYSGVLVQPSLRDIMLDGDIIICGAGVSLSRLCAFACDNALSGLEFAYGIPGSVGGAVYMNAGAYGGEMRDVVVAVSHIEPGGKRGELKDEELDFSYRHSAYSACKNIITMVTLRLKKGSTGAIRAKMDDYMKRRRDNQPLEYPSAGSTFKRPEGAYASELVDRCGLKGLSVGGAMVSKKHAGFLINYDNASAADMLALISQVRDEVKRKTGFCLECEIKQMGDFK